MKALRADSPIRIQPRETCPHDRVYTWFPRLIANDPNSPVIVCCGCCDCGAGWTAGTLKRGKVAERYRAELAAATGGA